uniref:Uncharacterized protein n=1 Tax=Arundo donax TaxID=35708 RepID=A0A0A9H6B0_ARUDO
MTRFLKALPMMGTLSNSLWPAFYAQQPRMLHHAHSNHNFGKVRRCLQDNVLLQAVSHNDHKEGSLCDAETAH